MEHHSRIIKRTVSWGKIKPQFQQLTGEKLSEKTAHRRDDTRTGIAASWFWQTGQQAFYGVRVFYLNAKLCLNGDIQKCYELNEKEKKKACNKQMLNVAQVERYKFTIALNCCRKASVKHIWKYGRK